MMDRYNRAIAAAHAASSDEEAIRLAELSALVEATLGEPLDRATFLRLAAIQRVLRADQAALVDELAAGKITPTAYLDRLNDVLRAAMERSRLLLGDNRFHKIFGEAGMHPEGIADREAFFAQFDSGSH